MNYNTFDPNAAHMFPFVGSFLSIFILLFVIDLLLKAWALWRAARMSKPVLFIILLVVNSAGILPLIFLLVTYDDYRKQFPLKRTAKPVKSVKRKK